MNPSYVESGHFNCVDDREIGCRGTALRFREYILKQNPDQRPSNDLSSSIVSLWTEAGRPTDFLVNYGSFFRITETAN